MTDAKVLAARSWFGYGRWDAPYWFVGMEPGGEDEAASYDAWVDLDVDRVGLVDCRAHHLWRRESLGVEDRKWTRWHDGDRPPTQPTWRRLIQLLLSYKGEPADMDAVSKYQRSDLGSTKGETALLEVAAANSPRLSGLVPHRDERIATIRKHMERTKPEFAVMYGLGYRDIYERISGAPFDNNGYAWAGPTLCVLVEHPVAIPGKPAAWWIEKGVQMRATIQEHRSY